MASQELTWQAAAAKNILNARKKNGRLGNKKTRSGCITCKIRRVKCDEAKPECRRCQLNGRKCDGYQDFAMTTRSHQSLLGSQLSQSLGLADDERRPFDFFLSWTAPRLAGSLDKEFWCGHVLQLAQSESLVRDTLLALSTLYEHPQYMKSFHDAQTDTDRDADDVNIASPREVAHPRYDEHHLYALRLYNRAIQTFTQRMDNGKMTPLLAILSCLLFICVELIRDNVFATLSLFTRGMELIKDFDAALSEESDQGLVSIVRLMFARLSVLTTTSGLPPPTKVLPESVIVEQQPVFTDMSEARTALFDLMADSHAFIRDATAWKESLTREEGADGLRSSNGYLEVSILDSVSFVKPGIGLKPVQTSMFETGTPVIPGTINSDSDETLMGRADNSSMISDDLDRMQVDHTPQKQLNPPAELPTPDDLLEQETAIQERLQRWLDAFQWLKKQYEENEPETSSHLLMYYHVSVIWFSTRLKANQTVFDDYTYHFREIIKHAQVYIKAKAIERPTFTLEVGAVPPLYFAATKCRIPSLRRRALDLITQAPGKECMWGASGTAELVCRLITIEENGLGIEEPDCRGNCSNIAVDDTILPDEKQRVHNLELLRNHSTHAFDVRVVRYSLVGGRLRRETEDFPI